MVLNGSKTHKTLYQNGSKFSKRGFILITMQKVVKNGYWLDLKWSKNWIKMVLKMFKNGFNGIYYLACRLAEKSIKIFHCAGKGSAVFKLDSGLW